MSRRVSTTTFSIAAFVRKSDGLLWPLIKIGVVMPNGQRTEGDATAADKKVDDGSQ